MVKRWVLCLGTLILSAPVTVLAVPGAKLIAEQISLSAYLLDEPAAFSAPAIQDMSAKSFNQQLKFYDPYASYTEAKQFAQLKKLSANKSASVGMDLVYDRQGRIRCIPFKGSPADNQGLEYQDILLKVAQRQVDGLSLEEVAELIRGAEQSSVELTVQKPDGRVESYVIDRIKASYADVEKSGSRPETIRIYRFSPGTAKLLERELTKLSSSPEQRIFLDLRGNTGGSFEEGAKCAALFLPQGATLYRLQTLHGLEERHTSQDGPACRRKVIILMDELTASAAELLISAAKQRPEVGTYGKTSAGKALVQDVFEQQDGAVLKFTVGELLFADRDESWQNRGISPDVEQTR